jgi:hypothetical protein
MKVHKKRLDISEKFMLKFREPEKSKCSMDGVKRQAIMKMCNDEGAFLEYKKGNIKFTAREEEVIDDNFDFFQAP